jgi:hypothetical protein
VGFQSAPIGTLQCASRDTEYPILPPERVRAHDGLPGAAAVLARHDQLERAIKAEMRNALSKLDAQPKLVARIDAADTLDAATLYRAAEDLGADRVLLAIIGSRGDTIGDEEAVAAIRNWNADRPYFDRLIASVDHPNAEHRPPSRPRRGVTLP